MRKGLKIAVAVLLAALIALGLWGLLEPRLLDIEYEEVRLAGLPASWDGQRIAQLSDWQVGIWLDNPATAEKAIEVIVAEEPALVVLSGDFIYHSDEDNKIPEDLRVVAELVRPLAAADIPTFAVLGNHDYSQAYPDDQPNTELAAEVAATLRREGVVVLENQATALRAPKAGAEPSEDSPLYLVGVGSHFAGRDRADQALKEVPAGAPRVAVMHNPDSFEQFPAGAAPLAMAGHTHGGQIRLPGLPSFSYMSFAKTDEVHADGWARGYGASGNRLYVNRGIGMSLVPLRINCRPELTFFRLQHP